MKRNICLGIVIIFLWIGFCFASNGASVTDNGGGNAGYILINDGSGQGHRGTWVNPVTVPALKGDKGDTGSQGIQGIAGLNGNDGLNGLDGKDGYAPIKGIDYFDGLNGLDGKDVDPATVTNLQNTDTTLQNNINTEATTRLIADDSIISSIDIEANNRLVGDTTLQNNINTETTNRVGADTKERRARIRGDNRLQTNIDNEAIIREDSDTLLKTNINTVDVNSRGRDTILQNNLDSEFLSRVNGDNSLSNRINDTNTRVDSLSNRLGKLERTQYKVQVAFRILDTRTVSVAPYVSQNITRGCVDEAGVRIMIKLGTSYEEREIAKTNTRLTRLEKTLGDPDVQEAIIQVKMSKLQVVTNGSTMSIKKEF